MARVTLFEPTNMTTVPTLPHPLNVTLSATEIDVYLGVPSQGWASLQGVSGDAFVVTQAFFDTGDPSLAPNLLFTDLNVALDAPLVTEFRDGNFQPVVTALLAGNDTVTGSGGSDGGIDGFAGDDVLRGGAGDDTLIGDQGRDILIGGPGVDRLSPDAYNGLGNDNVRDIIRYNSLTDSGTTPTTRDSVIGFIAGAGATADRIDLSLIDADPAVAGNQAFHLVTGFTAAHGEARLLYSGAATIIQVDGDADPAIDMTILVSNVHLHAIDLIL